MTDGAFSGRGVKTRGGMPAPCFRWWVIRSRLGLEAFDVTSNASRPSLDRITHHRKQGAGIPPLVFTPRPLKAPSVMHHSFRAALTIFTIALTAASHQASGASAEPNQPPAESAAAKPEAAGIGAWTTDYPAAVKVAQERKLPLFLQFTGSDWCGWCQKMEKECLSKPEF